MNPFLLKIRAGAIAGVALLVLVTPAISELLVYEPVDYPAGELAGRDGGFGWDGPYHEFSKTSLTVVGGDPLRIPSLVTNGSAIQVGEGSRLFRRIDSGAVPVELRTDSGAIGAPNSTIWLSLVVHVPEPIEEGFYGFSLFDGMVEALFLGKGTGETQGWKIQGGGSNFLSRNTPYDQTLLAVLRIQFGDAEAEILDRVSIFLNPDPAESGTAPDVATATLETEAGGFSFDRIRIAGNSGGLLLDQIRIGTSYASVTPAKEEGTVVTLH